jgi:hypothetical protein
MRLSAVSLANSFLMVLSGYEGNPGRNRILPFHTDEVDGVMRPP